MGAQWKVKHKEAASNAKGKIFGKLVKEITIAARNGADTATNAHLRLVVEQAKKASMPKETLEKIFAPFFTTKARGTGLGLAVVKKIIDRHKGRVEVTSVVGKGTCFKLFIPLVTNNQNK